MALIFLRHAAPLIAPGICYGRADIDTRSLDSEEISRLVERLSPAITRIDTSPLRRCIDLATRIAHRMNLPLYSDTRLQEIDFGRWELQAWDDIPRSEIDDWARDVDGARPHGGETVAEMSSRVRSYLLDHRGANGNRLAITHLGVVRCARAALGFKDALDFKLDYAEFITLEPKALS